MSTNLYFGLSPLIETARYLGFFNDKSKLNKRSTKMWLLLNILTVIWSFNRPHVINKKFHGNIQLILIFVDYTLLLCTFLNSLSGLILVGHMWNDKLYVVINELYKIDVFLLKFDIKHNYRKLKTRIIKFMMLNLLILSFTYKNLVLLEPLSQVIFNIISKFAIEIINQIFGTFCYMMFRQIQSINKILITTDKKKFTTQNIKNIFHIYCCLLETVRTVNNIFALSIFFNLQTQFFGMTSCAFRLFLNFANKTYENSTLLEITWLTYHIILLSGLHFATSSIQVEVRLNVI